jgi:hypothetical protein
MTDLTIIDIIATHPLVLQGIIISVLFLIFALVISISTLTILINLYKKKEDDLLKYMQVNEKNIKEFMLVDRSLFESISQRIIVLNKRLNIYFKQNGMPDIESLNKSSSHYVKNRRKNAYYNEK